VVFNIAPFQFVERPPFLANEVHICNTNHNQLTKMRFGVFESHCFGGDGDRSLWWCRTAPPASLDLFLLPDAECLPPLFECGVELAEAALGDGVWGEEAACPPPDADALEELLKGVVGFEADESVSSFDDLKTSAPAGSELVEKEWMCAGEWRGFTSWEDDWRRIGKEVSSCRWRRKLNEPKALRDM
jgi:hypothetical protein